NILLREDNATLISQDRKHLLEIGKWSDWIQVKFRIDPFTAKYGIVKFMLISTHPFKAYMTSIQIDPSDPIAQISHPKSYSRSIEEKIGKYYTLGMPEETDGYTLGLLDRAEFISQIRDIEIEKEKLFWLEFEEFEKKEKAVYAFVFDSLDRLQHVSWESDLNGQLIINQDVEEYYIQKDKLIGEALKRIDDDTLLLVFSDHGFSSYEKGVNMNTWLKQNGYLKLNENNHAPLFKDVDWKNTTAYSAGFNGIYINLKGRESYGIASDKRLIIDEIIAKLQNLTDPADGKKIIYKAYKSEEIYHGDHLDDAPDIIIGFYPGYRMDSESPIGIISDEIITANKKKWSGDHLIDPSFVPGILFSNARLNASDPNVIDIAPTILDALGIETDNAKLDGSSMLK
ncbi:MAG: alkaline phosphatase family protein, partial [Candidatus Woesearchaeota archaeon]|nr:alkaline phosphatase family protein [Candidatus Woesearchaeota archaeon]